MSASTRGDLIVELLQGQLPLGPSLASVGPSRETTGRRTLPTRNCTETRMAKGPVFVEKSLPFGV